MKEIKNKGITLKGIERNTNDINNQDGACEEIINLRHKDGALRPIGTKLEVSDITHIPGYAGITNIFKHSILDDNVYVGKLNNTIVLIDVRSSINPTTYSITETEIPVQFNLTIYIFGTYTITSNVSWLTLSDATGENETVLTVTSTPSESTVKTGTITATDTNGNTFTCVITKAATTYYVTPETQAIEASISTTEFGIESYIYGAYTIETDVNWITLSKSTGDYNESITVTVDEAPIASSAQDRVGTITFTDEDENTYTCVITQAYWVRNVTASVNDLTFLYGGETKYATVTTVYPNEVPVITDSDTWITASWDAENNRIQIICTENTGAERSGWVKATHPDDALVFDTITINQESNILSIDASPSTHDVDSGYGEAQDVFSFVDVEGSSKEFTESITDGGAWISITEVIQPAGFQPGRVYINILPNGTASPRTGHIRVEHNDDAGVYDVITINQEAGSGA